jgi:hypothetical protein
MVVSDAVDAAIGGQMVERRVVSVWEGLTAPLRAAPDVAVGPEEQNAEQQNREADYFGTLHLSKY